MLVLLVLLLIILILAVVFYGRGVISAVRDEKKHIAERRNIEKFNSSNE